MSIVKERMADHAAVLAATESLIPDIEKAGALVRDALAQGHKLLFCGNAAVLPIPSIWQPKLSAAFKRNGAACRLLRLP